MHNTASQFNPFHSTHDISRLESIICAVMLLTCIYSVLENVLLKKRALSSLNS